VPLIAFLRPDGHAGNGALSDEEPAWERAGDHLTGMGNCVLPHISLKPRNARLWLLFR
jgi:hypothetical protein